MKRFSILIAMAMFCGALALGCSKDENETSTPAEETAMSSGSEVAPEEPSAPAEEAAEGAEGAEGEGAAPEEGGEM